MFDVCVHAGRTGQLQRGMQAQMPGLVDDLDSLQLASHLSAKYEQAALSGASLSPGDHGGSGSANPASPNAPLPEVCSAGGTLRFFGAVLCAEIVLALSGV